VLPTPSPSESALGSKIIQSRSWPASSLRVSPTRDYAGILQAVRLAPRSVPVPEGESLKVDRKQRPRDFAKDDKPIVGIARCEPWQLQALSAQ
jgi:hypothetical protein